MTDRANFIGAVMLFGIVVILCMAIDNFACDYDRCPGKGNVEHNGVCVVGEDGDAR